MPALAALSQISLNSVLIGFPLWPEAFAFRLKCAYFVSRNSVGSEEGQ